MKFEKKVQFLSVSQNDSGLFVYDFLDLESNLPFSIYSAKKVEIYDKLKEYQVISLPFQLLRVNSKTGLAWKIRAGDVNE